MTNSQVIAQNTRELCKKNNISISKLNEDCGFSKNFINEMEKKSASPSIDKVLIIADYFNISLDELVGRKKSQNNNENSEDYVDIFIQELINMMNSLEFKQKVKMASIMIEEYENIEKNKQGA